jgi:hypothetical protein
MTRTITITDPSGFTTLQIVVDVAERKIIRHHAPEDETQTALVAMSTALGAVEGLLVLRRAVATPAKTIPISK